VVLSACADPRALAAPVVRTWEQLQGDLATNAADGWSNESFLKSSLFASFAGTTNKEVFLEMSSQREYPLVALAGFVCLRNSSPNDGLECAMNMVLEVKDGAIGLYAPLFDYLQARHNLAAFKRAFSSVSSRYPRDLRNYLVLVTALPVDEVYAWFHDESRAPVPPTCEAAVLDKLYGEPDAKTRPVTSAMSAALAKLEPIPGVSRAIYVMYAPDSVDKTSLLADLVCVLGDEAASEPQIVAVIHKRAGYVRELPLDTLKISTKRRELIKRVLQKAPK
jgi:hypothetical protein